MQLTSCLPTIIFLILAAASLFTSRDEDTSMASRVVSVATTAAVLQLLCQYGHTTAAWVVLLLILTFPVVLLVLLVLLGAVAGK